MGTLVTLFSSGGVCLRLNEAMSASSANKVAGAWSEGKNRYVSAYFLKTPPPRDKSSSITRKHSDICVEIVLSNPGMYILRIRVQSGHYGLVLA